MFNIKSSYELPETQPEKFSKNQLSPLNPLNWPETKEKSKENFENLSRFFSQPVTSDKKCKPR